MSKYYKPLEVNPLALSEPSSTNEYFLNQMGQIANIDLKLMEITKLLVPQKAALSGVNETASILLVYDNLLDMAYQIQDINDGANHSNTLTFDFGRVREIRNLLIFYSYKRGAAADVNNFLIDFSKDGTTWERVFTSNHATTAGTETFKGVVTGGSTFQFMRWTYESKGLSELNFYSMKAFL